MKIFIGPKHTAPFHDGLRPHQLSALVLLMVAFHAMVLWALTRHPTLRESVLPLSKPLWARMIAATTPAPPPPSTAPPAPPQPIIKTAPKTASPPPPTRSSPKAAPRPLEPINPTPASPAVTAPVSESPTPTPEAPIPIPSATPSATPITPRQIAASELTYLTPPVLQYPTISRENEESGTVLLRVLIDEEGLPKAIKVHKSSGFPNLDKAAIAAIQKTRFKPPTLHGQPTPGYAQIPLTFELEN